MLSVVEKRPFRAQSGPRAIQQGTWIYPTLALRGPGSGPGYRAVTAEDTVTRSQ